MNLGQQMQHNQAKEDEAEKHRRTVHAVEQVKKLEDELRAAVANGAPYFIKEIKVPGDPLFPVLLFEAGLSHDMSDEMIEEWNKFKDMIVANDLQLSVSDPSFYVASLEPDTIMITPNDT